MGSLLGTRAVSHLLGGSPCRRLVFAIRPVRGVFGSIAGLCCGLVLISNLTKPGSSAWRVVYPVLAIHASQFIFIVLIKPQVIFQVQIVFFHYWVLASASML